MRWALLGALLAPLGAAAEDAPCRRDGDRVSCDGASFKVLTDSCVQARANAQACALRLADSLKDTLATEAELHACQAALAAVPPSEPPRSTLRPLLGYGAGVVSSVLLITSLIAPLPDAARLTLGGVGLAGLTGGVILVVP